jgi:hypothetical protein
MRMEPDLLTKSTLKTMGMNTGAGSNRFPIFKI